MLRFRTLIATALLMIPMLAPSAATPTASAHRHTTTAAAAGSAPPGCYIIGNRLWCF